MINTRFRIALPILIIICGLLLAACFNDAPGNDQSDQIGATAGTEQPYMEPEAPPVTFSDEEATEQQTEEPADAFATQEPTSEPTVETPTYSGALDENELPPIPF